MSKKGIIARLQEEFIEKMDAVDVNLDYIQDRIELREKQIKRLKKRREKIKLPHWVHEIVEPLAQQIAERFPESEYGVGGPYGIGATVRITILEGVKSLLVLDIRPGQLSSGGIDKPFVAVDYSNVVNDFPPNSLGRINALQYAEVPINDMSIDELIKWVQDMAQRCEDKRNGNDADSV